MAPLNDYATTTDLEAFWRPLNGDEIPRATTLLHIASSYLRQIASNNTVDLEAKIVADTTGVYSDLVMMAVVSAVKRAMTTPADMPPADSWSQSASPYSETMQFTNPNQDLYFKNNELRLLGLSSIGGKSQFSLLRGARWYDDDVQL